MEAAPVTPTPPSSTREAILDAAERLFAERGFGETALRDVAAQAGVTRSLIHHHFGSKEGLWQEVVGRRFRPYARVQHGVLDREELGAEDLAESLGMMFRFLTDNPPVSRLHGWTNAGAGGGFPESGDLTTRGVARLREMQRAGKLRADLDPAAVLAAFFGLVEHWFQARPALRARFGDGLPDDDTYLETAMRMLLDGVRPEARP